MPSSRVKKIFTLCLAGVLSAMIYGYLSSEQGEHRIVQKKVSAEPEKIQAPSYQRVIVEQQQAEKFLSTPDTAPEKANAAQNKVIIAPDSAATAIIVRANVEGVYGELLENVKSGVVKRNYRIEYPNGDIEYTLISFIINKAPIEVIEKLIGLGVPVSPSNLISAASSGDIEKIEYLLSLGLHPNQLRSGPKALYIAAAGSGNLDALKIVHRLSDSWDLNELNNPPYLYDKALEISGNPEILDYLEQNGVEPSGLVESIIEEIGN